MSSDSEILSLRLVRNPKLLPALKSLSRRPLIVTGFKLTVGADAAARRAAVAAQFAAGGIDLVVHNDLEDIRRATAHPLDLPLDRSSADRSGRGRQRHWRSRSRPNSTIALPAALLASPTSVHYRSRVLPGLLPQEALRYSAG